MAWLWVVLVVVVLGLTAAVAVGRGGALERAYPDRRDVRLPAGRPVNADDLEDVEFSVVFRGYRMDEVDAVVERLAHELAARDAELAALEPLAARMRAAYARDDAAAASATDAAGSSEQPRGGAVGPRFEPVDRYPGAATPPSVDGLFAAPTDRSDAAYASHPTDGTDRGPSPSDTRPSPSDTRPSPSDARPSPSDARPPASAPYDQHADDRTGYRAPRPGAGDP